MTTEVIDAATVVATVARVADEMIRMKDYLTRLDAAVGDGDMGITAAKGAAALRAYVAETAPEGDLGRYLSRMGMAYNRAAPSTMGTVIATGLMRAGKAAQGLAALDGEALARMLRAADAGIQQRGKAEVGDKTVVDALHPAAEAFADAIARGEDLVTAGTAMLVAARAGRDAVIPLRSKVGRASWVGERTENQPDPGTVLFVRMVEAALGAEYSEVGSTSKT